MISKQENICKKQFANIENWSSWIKSQNQTRKWEIYELINWELAATTLILIIWASPTVEKRFLFIHTSDSREKKSNSFWSLILTEFRNIWRNSFIFFSYSETRICLLSHLHNPHKFRSVLIWADVSTVIENIPRLKHTVNTSHRRPSSSAKVEVSGEEEEVLSRQKSTSNRIRHKV